MVLHHLIIANTRIAEIVEHLAVGKIYPRELTIPDVKPSLDADPGMVDRFAACMQEYQARIAALGPLRTGVRCSHPWFGPLDGHDWHSLAGLHETIHRRQIERIIRVGKLAT